MNRQKRCAAPLLAALAFAGIAAAQGQPGDPPSRVARLSYMTGAVSFEPASVDDWAAASLNYPVSTGDNLYTDPNNARAVLRIARNSIRLAPGTNFQMVQLTDQVAQMSINSGAISVRVKKMWPGETWEIDTPNGAVTLSGPGEYRVDTDPDRNATMITVRSGQTQVTSNDQSFFVAQGQTAYVDANNQPQIVSQNPNDAFDEFAVARDRMEDVPPPAYVSADMSGYEDLQTSGTWRDGGGDYGQVWFPRVDSGWAPYQDGHWAWVDPWGWTWVDNAPWGFAPFHYGRWANIGGAWGWLPGPVSVRPVYAPALVAFIGGSSWGVGFSLGGGAAVGWFPLGPREPYFPSYHVSDTYVRQVNISNTRITNVTILNNTTNIRNVTYVNQRVPGAVVAVSQNQFAGGGSIAKSVVHVQPAQLANAHVVGAAAPVVPQRAAVLASAGGARPVVRPPANVVSRPVVARIAPPPAAVPFAAKQQMLQQHPGQPVAPQQMQALRASAPAAPNRTPVRPIVASQVHAITPPVSRAPVAAAPSRPGVVAAPPPVNRGGQAPAPAANVGRPNNAPVPMQPNAPRPANVPPAAPMGRPAPQSAPPVQQPRPQAAPPVQQPRPQAAPPVQESRPQAAPPVQQPRPQAVPPVQQQRPQAAPPMQEPRQQAVPPVQQPRPQAAPPQERPQVAPAPRQAPPPQERPQVAPAPRQAPPPQERPQAAPAPRPAPVPQAAPRQAPPPQRPAPAPKPAPKEPPKEEKDKK